MAIRILTKNGIENTNIDGARDNNFNAGRRSGIVKDALNSGNLYGSSNILTLEPCELRLCGHRIVIDDNQIFTFNNKPQTATQQSLIAQVQVNNEDVLFELIVQNSSTSLTQDNLDISGNGTYQLEIATFTQKTDGTISNVVRTAELISGSAEDKANKDLSNVTYPQIVADGVAKIGAGDRVIESKIYSDGKTWYRKWASGWKECGLINQTGNGEKTLPVTFSTTNYIAICFTYRFDNSSYQPPYNQISGGVLSTSKISTGGFGNIPFSVYCCGY